VAEGLGMKSLPEPLPRALPKPAKPEVTQSPALSLMARPGDGSILGRKIAILVADGVQGEVVAQVQQQLVSQGAVARLVGPRIGPVVPVAGDPLDADCSTENEPGFLFDGLVLPDGEQAVTALSRDGHVFEFIKDQFRHCKPILALGASKQLLEKAMVPLDGNDAALIVDQPAAEGTQAFVQALAAHRNFARETDPPLV
jgi:catalase